ncbi:MAG: 50S ribosomal protein L16 [Xanthomonadaceae bacterium]|nr:50S ribosomal protein L16 [Rhodospirillaceae bacterium]NIA17821.1 50S ribosomal protein L16 [Xanthomonadaceae bacterium]
MLAPKKTKYRKTQKGRRRKRNIATSRIGIAFGDYGLKAQSFGWVDSRQIEAARRAITHLLKRKGKMWIRIFPDKAVTAKGAEMPMGKGKGSVDRYVAVVRSGMILFEIAGVSKDEAKEAMKLAEYKLSIQCKFISK